MLAGARNPIIITKALGPRSRRGAGAGAARRDARARRSSGPVHTYVNFPQDHPLHAGFERAAHLGEADVILVVESDVPWYPAHQAPEPGDAR